MTVGQNAELHLSGGVYNFTSIKAQKSAKLLFGGSSEVRVEGNVETGKGVVIGPLSTALITASDIVFYVKGKKASFGKDTMVQANLYTLNGMISLNRSDAEGAFIGAKVDTGTESQVILDSAFK